MDHPKMNEFLGKHTCHTVKSISHARKKCTKEVYDDTIENIRKAIGDDPIWFSIDETIDLGGRYAFSGIVGSTKKPGIRHTLHIAAMDGKDNKNVINFLLNVWKYYIQWITFQMVSFCFRKKTGKCFLVHFVYVYKFK